MSRPSIASLIFAACTAAFGQGTPPTLAFEVASIQPAVPVPTPLSNGQTALSIRMGTQVDGSRIRLDGYALRDLILQAYRVKDQQLSGPDWMTDQRYSINATMPAGSSNDQAPEMLQSLLRERFGLRLHRESKEMSVYVLVTAKGGPKLKALQADPSTGKDGSKSSGPAAGGPMGITMARSASVGPVRIALASADMKSLADYLARQTDRPVIDGTGLTGRYAIELRYAPENAFPGGDADAAPSLFTALQEQLGLRLEARKAPGETLVVDRLEKTPTAN